MNTLKELAKDYAQGRLTKADYRQHRVNLIKAILAAEVEVKEYVFQDPTPPQEDITEQSSFDPLATAKMANVSKYKEGGDDNDITMPDASARLLASEVKIAKTEVKTEQPKSNLTWLYIATVVVLFIVIALTFLMLRSGFDDSSTNTEAEKQTQTLNILSASDRLISDFLANANWQSDKLNEFIQSWQQLSDEDRQKTRESTHLSQLSSAIYKKILAEKALMTIGETESAANQQKNLIDFAKAIGIDDPKIITPTE